MIKLLVNQVKVPIEHSEADIKAGVEKKLHHKIKSFEIRKRSLDARKEPFYVYSLIVEAEEGKRLLSKDVSIYVPEDLHPKYEKRDKTIIVAGYGPSGIFAAYRLMEAGFKVLVFENGKRIKDREADVKRFFETGILNTSSNVQFGEGGAGTFSDAKLTTRIKDKYIDYILDIFVKHGADQKIRYENHAHIGTDEIRKIISSITDDMAQKGVEFHFEEEMKEILLDEGRKIVGIRTEKGTYLCDLLAIGLGHSAYESVKMLKEKGVHIENKDISIGFRVEHPQSFIDARQTNSIIEAANEYFLRYKGEKGVYSFCMCPGGFVIPAMSDEDTIVTNGMSYAARDSGVANSAILIQIFKEEFEDGYAFLHDLEHKAFAISSSYKALSQNIADFMKGESNPLIFDSTYPLGTVLYDFNDFFSEKDCDILKQAFLDFDRKIPGFIEKGIMVGPETRSSCPIRILRDEHFQSINTPGLYSMGEGAGYGGGIMSCALDGIRIANELILNHG